MIGTAARIGRRLLWPLLVTAALALVFALGALPVRTYFEKKQEVAASEAKVAALTERNDAAQRHVDALRTDAEIERLAREQYGLVKPGEETYHVLPAPQDPVTIPDVWPFDQLHQHLGR